MTIPMKSRLSHALIFATVLSVCQPTFASDDSSTTPAKQGASDVEALKAQLAQQQMQLEQLKATLEAQKKLIDALAKGAAVEKAAVEKAAVPAKPANLGDVASLTPMVPAAPASSPDLNTLPAIPASAAQAAADEPPSPLSLKIGSSYITPVGFMDFTSVNRTTVGGNGIGSNFGSIPYNNNAAGLGGLSEFRLSAQNSRIGARFDSSYKGAHILGYWESDFLGNNATNVAVTSNPDTFRLRLYWVDISKDHWELMGGQSWSLMTPGRTGISPIPGNIFYSQNMDVNYQVGLTWTRQPGIRIVYHADKAWTIAFAAENAEQYVGGGGGAGTVTSPAAFASTVYTQFNNAATTLTTPNLTPDFIAKIAFDPNSRFHGEVVGLNSNFKDYVPTSTTHYTKSGGGVAINMNAELFKGFRLIETAFYSDGGGRYMFGEAPDVVLKANGDIGLVHASSGIAGFEDTIKNTLLFGYYGIYYIGRYTVVDANGKSLVGWGYTGSANNQNRSIQEPTLGFKQTFWKDPKYGAIDMIGQFSWLNRDPWYVAVGQPKNAHQIQIYFDLRYTLPGSAPMIK
jgi:hypothetical protein